MFLQYHSDFSYSEQSKIGEAFPKDRICKYQINAGWLARVPEAC